MRIVGGEARGRTLLSVPGDATRPTADRVRQSLFDLLGQRCDGLAVLDLYSGTGALALEALSRGAASAVLVEQSREAAKVIEENLATLRYADRARVLKDDVTRALGALALRGERFDLIFSDPPYALRAAQSTLEQLARHGLLAPGGRLVLERDKHEPAPLVPAGYALDTERTYGDTAVLVISRQ
jgi:16S rRNA (guanine966-N2)-methyltransferase